jgi:hypothetical protein
MQVRLTVENEVVWHGSINGFFALNGIAADEADTIIVNLTERGEPPSVAASVRCSFEGLECLDETLRDGVMHRLIAHIDRLEWIMEMIVEEAKRERKSVATMVAT